MSKTQLEKATALKSSCIVTCAFFEKPVFFLSKKFMTKFMMPVWDKKLKAP